jgi:hypothetical protein
MRVDYTCKTSWNGQRYPGGDFKGTIEVDPYNVKSKGDTWAWARVDAIEKLRGTDGLSLHAVKVDKVTG